MPIFSSSPLATGAIAELMDGLGNSVGLMTVPLCLSPSVSRTFVTLSFTSAPMSPACSLSASWRFFPSSTNSPPSRSAVLRDVLWTSVPGVNAPWKTRTHSMSPTCGSEMFLNTYASGAPAGSFLISWPSLVAHWPVSAPGNRRTMASRTSEAPMLWAADAHRTGKICAPRTPAARPTRNSSSERDSVSRYFSISFSSDSAADSINSLRSALALSFKSAGMSIGFTPLPSFSNS